MLKLCSIANILDGWYLASHEKLNLNSRFLHFSVISCCLNNYSHDDFNDFSRYPSFDDDLQEDYESFIKKIFEDHHHDTQGKIN